MEVVIIDDEAAMRENLRTLLAMYADEISVIGEADGVEKGLALLRSTNPEVVFLDIEMKDGSGFDLLSRFGEADFKVVFVTGHNQYAIRAFKYSAIDYLIKPVDPIELKESIQKIKREARDTQHIANLIDNQGRSFQDQKIVLKDADVVYLVPVKEIIRCQSDSNYTVFFLNDGRRLMTSKTLKEYDKLFEGQPFFRIHQSHLINLHFFDRYHKREGGVVYMKDGTKLPVASRKKEDFIAYLQQQ